MAFDTDIRNAHDELFQLFAATNSVEVIVVSEGKDYKSKKAIVPQEQSYTVQYADDVPFASDEYLEAVFGRKGRLRDSQRLLRVPTANLSSVGLYDGTQFSFGLKDKLKIDEDVYEIIGLERIGHINGDYLTALILAEKGVDG